MANILDKFNKVLSGTTRPVATTLAAEKASGATSATVVSTTGWDTDTAVHGIMYRTNSAGEKVAGSQIDWKATVSGTTLSNFTVTAGVDDTYAIGSTVELAPTAAWGDDMATGASTSLDQTTGHIATTGVATFTDHIDVADTKAIRDGNDNELIKFSQTASAVNEITVKNAATGNPARIEATGNDTNIGLNFVTKGTGEHQLNGVAFSGAWTSWTPTWANASVGNGSVDAKYKQIGKTVHFRLVFILGSTSTIGTGPTFTLPVTSASYNSIFEIGSGKLFDTSANGNYRAGVKANSTTIGGLEHWDLNNNTLSITSTSPMTWGNGDAILVSGTYEAA